MKFEEVLGALKEGKKIRRKEWEDIGLFVYCKNKKFYSDKNNPYFFPDTEIFEDDWEIIEEPKKKVKLYRVLYKVKFKNREELKVSDYCVSKLEYYKHNGCYIMEDRLPIIENIRLITEIPELIEEREE